MLPSRNNFEPACRPLRFRLAHAAAAAMALCLATAGARADQASSEESSSFAVHGQSTLVVQGVDGFRSPYVGPNSLTPHQVKETFDATLFAGLRPWQGTELWVNPEVDQGFGLSNTLGVAGFPSGEAYKVGKSAPYFRLQRLFVRQTVGLGGEREEVEGEANRFRRSQPGNRLVLTLGKFSVVDVFDTNSYAHDPRGDFLDWTAIDTGAFDYAADAWGYSTGAAAEWYQGPWTLRLGLFNLSRLPNGKTLETNFSQNELVGEVEHRHRLGGRPGAVRFLVYRNRGRFGRFDEALAAARAGGIAPDTALVRRTQSRAGVALNAEQEVSDTLGLFVRAGLVDGAIEPYEFTDVDRSLAAGASLKGNGWGRPHDRIGFAAIVNGVSPEHERYLGAGGLGVLIGDGRLSHPGAEAIGEAYYDWHATKGIDVSLDGQLVVNPGYNRDRGPVPVLALRLHGAF